MDDWSRLRHSYGSAEDVPALLAKADTTRENEGGVWDELWSRLCHQGSVHTGSYAALPALSAMTAKHAPAGYVPSLHLAAAIVASIDGPEDPAAVRLRYEGELAVLRDAAERNLALADGEAEFVYALQALMAFEDGGVWQRHLHSLADAELSLECPGCGGPLLMPLDGPEVTMTRLDDSSSTPTPVIPYDPADSDEGAHLLTLARAHGHDEVATRLHYLFGLAACPWCGAQFKLADALA